MRAPMSDPAQAHRPSGGSYRGRSRRERYGERTFTIYGEEHQIRTLNPPNRNYSSGILTKGSYALDTIVSVTLPVIRFGRNDDEIYPTIKVRI